MVEKLQRGSVLSDMGDNIRFTHGLLLSAMPTFRSATRCDCLGVSLDGKRIDSGSWCLSSGTMGVESMREYMNVCFACSPDCDRYATCKDKERNKP